MSKEQKNKSKEQYLFILPKGNRLTRDRAIRRMKLLCNKAGFAGGWHQWRRACFTNYANKGVPLSSLRLIAGHSSILTTQSYIRPDVQEVVQQMESW